MKKFLMAAAAVATLAGTPAWAAGPLRVCVSDDDLPYTNARQEGFEDRLATILAEALDTTVERVAFPDPRYLVRDGMDKNRCDVMLGADASDMRMHTTRPYYRSSYVFLTRAKDGLDVRNWQSPVLQTARLGTIPGTPAEAMLTQIGRHADTFRYMMSLGGNKAMRNRFVRYDVEKLVRDLAAGEIDVAIAWAPAVARYVRNSPVPLTATVVPDDRKSNGEAVLFSYDTSVGVRKGDAQLLARVEAALQKSAPRIEQVLAAEGIFSLSAPTRVSTAAAETAR